MNQNLKENLPKLIVIGIIVFALVAGGIAITRNLGKDKKIINKENAESSLAEIVANVGAHKVIPTKASIEASDMSSNVKKELPKIDESYPLTVKGEGEINIEIFSSTEKAGKGTDSWLNEVANNFNKSGCNINGKTVSMSVRSIPSGTGVEYITSGAYLPQAFTPSNEYLGKMIETEGIPITKVSDKLVGNVAGILLSNSTYNTLVKKYGSINMKTITEATSKNEIQMGYTNPLSSATGLNFLINTLYTYDHKDILSEKAKEGFNKFQTNVPFVAFTTAQMTSAASNGKFDGMVTEYQSYINSSELSNKYKFTPFGIKHDNPLYAIGSLSEEQNQALQKIIEYCTDKSSQELATKDGFNKMDNYKSEVPEYKGDQIINAQKLWKDNKNQSKPIAAVFVADTSGSMDGEPINSLKNSLINSMKYINSDNYVGLVTYNDDTNINLDLKKFDMNQQCFFKGAVQSMSANGGTATFDAVAVGMDMLLAKKKEDPNIRPILFVLSDGEQNTGVGLDEISDIVKSLDISIYTIGYNANIDALNTISNINEGVSINADSEDVTYKLKNLFNSEL